MNETDPIVAPVRCFAALPLPDDVKEALIGYKEQLRNAFGRNGVRWVGPDRMHLTLRFFGNVRETQISEVTAALASIAATTQPFTLETGSPGSFLETRYPKVIWIGLSGCLSELERLQSAVALQTRAWGDPPDEKSFRPHLTLGRVKTTHPRELGALRAAIGQLAMTKARIWNAHAIELIQSTLEPSGPAYRRLAEFPFLALIRPGSLET